MNIKKNRILYKEVYVTPEQKRRFEWLDSMYAKLEYVPTLKQTARLYNQEHEEPLKQGTLWYAIVQWGVINKIATGYGERGLQNRRKSPKTKKVVADEVKKEKTFTMSAEDMLGTVPFIPDNHLLLRKRNINRKSYAEAIRDAVEARTEIASNLPRERVETNYKTNNMVADVTEMDRVLKIVDRIEKMRHLSFIFLNVALITLIVAIIATLIK